MEKDTFIIEQLFDAPVEKIWKAITGKDEMKKWYFDLAEFIPVVDFKFQFAAGEEGDKQYVHLCRITEVEVNKKLSYSWCYQNFSGKSLVTFDLTKKDQQTMVKLTHAGIASFPKDSPDFAYESFAKGWAYIIGTSLLKYLEEN